MASFQYIGLQQSTTKVLNLWNGSGNNAPPANWHLVGFDDSGWSASSAPTGTGPRLNPNAASYNTTNKLPSDTQPIAPWTTPPDTYAGFLVRARFTLPSSPWQYYMLEQFWANALAPSGGDFYGFLSLFINGSEVGFWWEVSQYLVSGDNLVAFKTSADPIPSTGQNWLTTTSGFVSFRFAFWQPDTGGQANSWGTITAGVNDKGVLGVGDTATHLVPTQCAAALPTNVTKIVSNGSTTLFLTADQQVWACGDNSQGLLGIGSTDSAAHATPVQIIPNANAFPTTFGTVIDIAIGFDCAMALTRDNKVYVWGPNAHGSFGMGTTTADSRAWNLITTPTGGVFKGVQRIAAGGDFSVIQPAYDQFNLQTAGGNSNGQLSQGTSGSDVTTFADAVGNTSSLDPKGPNLVFAAGDTQRPPPGASGNSAFCGAGDGTTGSLGQSTTSSAFTKLSQSSFVTPLQLSDLQQHGPMSFFLDATGSVLGCVGGILLVGDGTPYGGAADNSGAVIYGTSSAHTEGYVHKDSAGTVLCVSKLAEASASHNPYASGASKIAMAAVGQDALLYTWGYGGFGQMGTGADLTTNLLPIHSNGLSNVLAAAIANQIAFAVGDGGQPAPSVSSSGRSWAQVIGD